MPGVVLSIRKYKLSMLQSSSLSTLQSALDLLKKTNADIIYKVNMHDFKEVYRMTAYSDIPPDRTIWCFT